MNLVKYYINEIISELSMRVGAPDLTKPAHINIMTTIMYDMGIPMSVIYEIKSKLLGEADEKRFTNQILNKTITYTDNDGEQKSNIVGNLLTLDKDHPGRKRAEQELQSLSPEDYDELMNDLGSQGKTGAEKMKDKPGGDAGEEPIAGEEKPQTITGREPGYDLSNPEGEYAKQVEEEEEALRMSKKTETGFTEEDVKRNIDNSLKIIDKVNEIEWETEDGETQIMDSEITDKGSLLIGVLHNEDGRYDKQIDSIINQIKQLPKDTRVMYVGEGGMDRNLDNSIEFSGEMAQIRDGIMDYFTQFEESSWDQNANVRNSKSPVFDAVAKEFGGDKSKANASIWSNMVSQGDDLDPNDYLDEDGKRWLITQAKKGGSEEFNGYVDWRNLTDAQKEDLYQLNFRDDEKYGETEIFKGQEAYNSFRQSELDKKIKTAEAEGWHVIAPMGNSHVDMWRKRNKPEDKKFVPTPLKNIYKELPDVNQDVFTNKSDIPNIPSDQKKQISMKIDELASAVGKGEDFNLCQITIPGTNLYCDDNQGIPREQMPQFKGKPLPGTPADSMARDNSGEVDTEPLFKKMLKERGIKTVEAEVPSDRLKATQSELVGTKVAGMAKALEKDPNHAAITAPIYVSRDGYVIDGHHRWAAVTSAAIQAGRPANMKVIIVDMDIKEAIPMCNKFAEDQGIAAKKADATDGKPEDAGEELPKPKPADETPNQRVYNVGGNYYSDTPDGPAQYIKTESVIEKIFIEEDASFANLIFEAVVKKIDGKGNPITLTVIEPKDQAAATEKASKKLTPKNISSQQKSARNLLKKLDVKTLKIDNPELSDDEFEYIQKLANSLDEFLNNETPDDRKREIAAEIKDTYGLTTNTETTDANGNSVDVKIYIKKNVGGRKLPRSIEKVLNKNASKPSTNLVDELNKYLDEDNQIAPNTIGGNSESTLKVEFEKAAKPSFKIDGGETKREKVRKNPNANIRQKDPNNTGYDKNGQPLTLIDPIVSEIFKQGTALGDLKESMHSIEGPADDNGNLIPCNTPENKRKHFDFLVNSNESNKRVKQAAQKYIDDASVSESDKDKFRNIIKEIDEYEAGMNGILNKVPSDEASNEVRRLNAKLMDGLHNAHPDIASGMAKQFAENALVTQEIADGDEVYMPSQGTFPGGDKILVTRKGAVMEAVAGVSVKFGRGSKETQIYGFPGEAQSMANFAEPDRKENETDDQYEKRKLDLRTRNGKYVGQDGYLIGVRDDIINNENKFNEVLSQSRLDAVITDMKQLHQITKEIQSEVQRYIEKQQQLGRSSQAIRISLQQYMRGWLTQNNIEARFEECIDRNKLTKMLTGSNDGKYTDVNGDEKKHSNLNVARKCNPIEFMSLTAFASSVKEGKGMPSLYWNHQSYEDGEYHSQTTNPSDTDMTDLSNWGFNTRMWATSSRDGGGLLATGTGESKHKGKPLKNMEDVV
jgi:ribosomal protein S13